MKAQSSRANKLLGAGFVNMGHRGTRNFAPENTKIAFQLANQYTNFFELDVMPCATEELVVIHDPTLDRTTNGKGPIEDWRWEDLSKLDAGSWFSSKFAKEPIPKLQDLLDSFPQSVTWDIELKSQSSEQERDRFANLIVRILSEKNRKSHCFLSSFDHNLLNSVRDKDPEISLGFLFEPGLQEFPEIPEMEVFLPNYQDVTQKLAEQSQQKGIPLLPYTVNAPEDWEKFLQWNLKGVITDAPDKLKEFLLQKNIAQS